jgi:hypothetical protein
MQDNYVRLIFTIIFSSAFIFSSNSQVIFQEKKFEKSFYSGITTAVADINGDYIDDLIILDQSKKLWIGQNSGNGNYIWTSEEFKSGEGIWSISVGDIDRDNKNDILIAGDPSGLIVLYNTFKGFTRTNIENSNFFPQASTLYDLNNDGYLDYTVCDDNAKSRIYINDKSGRLVYDPLFIDLSLPNPSWEAGNYGCTWTDFDADGDADLYLSRCRAGVEDPTDMRRKNLFYVNDNGIFKEKGSDYGIGIFDQSWCSSFRDLDGDQLADLIVINHYSPINVFKQKSDHHFENNTIAAGINFNGIPIQLAIEDFDNDGDQDVLISGTSTELWLNNGQMNFSKSNFTISEQSFSSFSIGDLNRDGFLDLYCSYADLLNNPNNKKDRIFHAEPNGNHFINFTLHGQASNPNGIATKFYLKSNGKTQYRELNIGESFGVQNSLNVHFGLGKNSIVDELTLIWPSGKTSTFTQLEIDQHYIISEDDCIKKKISIYPADDQILCNQSTVRLKAENYSDIIWNNGSTDSINDIVKEGINYYRAKDKDGCSLISNSVGILFDPDIELKLNYSKEQNICSDEFIELSIDGHEDVIWQNGTNSKIQFVNNSGIFYGKIIGKCREHYSDTVVVNKNTYVSPPIINAVQIPINSNTTIQSNSNFTNWYESKEDPNPIFTGPMFSTPKLVASRSYWASAFELLPYESQTGGLSTPQYKENPFQAAFLNPSMNFHVYKDFILESVTVYTDRPGKRKIELINGNKEIVDSVEVDLIIGKNIVKLDFHCEAKAGSYNLATNAEVNKSQFQTVSPWLERSDINFTYPMFISDLCKINTSSLGDSYYYFFYDWVLRKKEITCESNRIEVKVNIITDIDKSEIDTKSSVKYLYGTNEISFQNFLPNTEITILDIQSKIVLQTKINSDDRLSVSFPSGQYIILAKNRDIIKHFKLLKYE